MSLVLSSFGLNLNEKFEVYKTEATLQVVGKLDEQAFGLDALLDPSAGQDVEFGTVRTFAIEAFQLAKPVEVPNDREKVELFFR